MQPDLIVELLLYPAHCGPKTCQHHSRRPVWFRESRLWWSWVADKLYLTQSFYWKREGIVSQGLLSALIPTLGSRIHLRHDVGTCSIGVYQPEPEPEGTVTTCHEPVQGTV